MQTTISAPIRAFLLTAFALLAAGNSFAGATLDRIKQTGVIHIGYRESGLPFSYKNSENGAPLGYGIDVCVALADAIKQELKIKGAELKYVPVAGAARITAVAEGKIELECANTTNTKARREQVAFAMPYYFASARLLVKDGSGITKIDDMAGKTLVVTKGSTGLMIAEARRAKSLSNMKLMVVDTSAEGAAAVDSGAADAFMTDDILLHGLKAQAKNPMSVVGPSMSVEPLAVMYSKTDPELEAIITKEMAHLYTSGKMKAIYKKWFQSPLPQRSYSLSVNPGTLLSDMFSRPSGFVFDWVML